jgi:hypothetical protein
VLVVNGIPVDLILSPSGGIPITEWTQSGENEVEVVVQSQPDTREPFQFQVCSATTPDGKDIKPEANPVQIPVPPPPHDTTKGTTVFQAAPRDPWVWQNAAIIDQLTEQDQQEINNIFLRFCNAFLKKDVNEVLAVTETGSTIKARALGLTVEQARTNDRNVLEQIFANAANIHVINPSAAQVRPFRRGVMIFPTQLDGSMHLVYIDTNTEPKQNYIFDFLTLCKIDGKWVRVN